MKFSIILPTYNPDPALLKQAIDSAINQTYKDFELIIVNDGSFNTKSCSFLDSIKKDYPSVVVANLPNNNGLSCARNEGVKKSKGDFIIFLDDDDCLSLYFLEQVSLINSLQPNELVFLANTNYYNELAIESKPDIENTIINKEGIFHFFSRYKNKDSLPIVNEKSVWGKVFPREIFFTHNIWFDEKQKSIGEDVIFLWSLIPFIKQIYCIDFSPFYFYRLRNNSLTNGYKNDALNKYLQLTESLYSIAKNQEPSLIGQLYYEICNVYIFNVMFLDIFNKENCDSFFKKKKRIKLFLNNEIVKKAYDSDTLNFLVDKNKRRLSFLVKHRFILLFCIICNWRYKHKK